MRDRNGRNGNHWSPLLLLLLVGFGLLYLGLSRWAAGLGAMWIFLGVYVASAALIEIICSLTSRSPCDDSSSYRNTPRLTKWQEK